MWGCVCVCVCVCGVLYIFGKKIIIMLANIQHPESNILFNIPEISCTAIVNLNYKQNLHSHCHA